MNKKELARFVRFMRAKYPKHDFGTVAPTDVALEDAMNVENRKEELICFWFDTFCMIDPFHSVCMRYPADASEYGLDEKDARKIYIHNFPPEPQRKRK